MKKFVITVDTCWCGMDKEYPAIADSEVDLWDVAEELAYQNFNDFELWEDIAEEYGYNTTEMTNKDWEELQSSVDESEYYSWSVDEFTGTKEDWEILVNDAGQIIYGDV